MAPISLPRWQIEKRVHENRQNLENCKIRTESLGLRTAALNRALREHLESEANPDGNPELVKITNQLAKLTSQLSADTVLKLSQADKACRSCDPAELALENKAQKNKTLSTINKLGRDLDQLSKNLKTSHTALSSQEARASRVFSPSTVSKVGVLSTAVQIIESSLVASNQLITDTCALSAWLEGALLETDELIKQMPAGEDKARAWVTLQEMTDVMQQVDKLMESQSQDNPDKGSHGNIRNQIREYFLNAHEMMRQHGLNASIQFGEFASESNLQAIAKRDSDYLASLSLKAHSLEKEVQTHISAANHKAAELLARQLEKELPAEVGDREPVAHKPRKAGKVREKQAPIREPKAESLPDQKEPKPDREKDKATDVKGLIANAQALKLQATPESSTSPKPPQLPGKNRKPSPQPEKQVQADRSERLPPIQSALPPARPTAIMAAGLIQPAFAELGHIMPDAIQHLGNTMASADSLSNQQGYINMELLQHAMSNHPAWPSLEAAKILLADARSELQESVVPIEIFPGQWVTRPYADTLRLMQSEAANPLFNASGAVAYILDARDWLENLNAKLATSQQLTNQALQMLRIYPA